MKISSSGDQDLAQTQIVDKIKNAFSSQKSWIFEQEKTSRILTREKAERLSRETTRLGPHAGGRANISDYYGGYSIRCRLIVVHPSAMKNNVLKAGSHLSFNNSFCIFIVHEFYRLIRLVHIPLYRKGIIHRRWIVPFFKKKHQAYW